MPLPHGVDELVYYRYSAISFKTNRPADLMAYFCQEGGYTCEVVKSVTSPVLYQLHREIDINGAVIPGALININRSGFVFFDGWRRIERADAFALRFGLETLEQMQKDCPP